MTVSPVTNYSYSDTITETKQRAILTDSKFNRPPPKSLCHMHIHKQKVQRMYPVLKSQTFSSLKVKDSSIKTVKGATEATYQVQLNWSDSVTLQVWL